MSILSGFIMFFLSKEITIRCALPLMIFPIPYLLILSFWFLSSSACSLLHWLSHIILISVRLCPQIFVYKYLIEARKLNWKPWLPCTLFFEAIKQKSGLLQETPQGPVPIVGLSLELAFNGVKRDAFGRQSVTFPCHLSVVSQSSPLHSTASGVPKSISLNQLNE